MASTWKRKAYTVIAPRIFVFAIIAVALTTSFASAADLKGRVINGTTRTPAIDDEVILLGPSDDGMNEIARTRTNRAGQFGLRIKDARGTHVVRVVHEGVTYHQVLPPGVDMLVVNVYDVSPKVDGISAVMDAERFESIDDRLEIKQLVTVRNESKPPRTQMKDHSFEVQLPLDAKVQYGLIQVEDAQPLKKKPIAGDQLGQYYFDFPIRPGDTRFAVVYQIPYEGEATVKPTVRNPRERFVAMLPKSMKFEPTNPAAFHPMENTTLDNVYETEPVTIDQTVSFHISGTGVLAELEGQSQIAKDRKVNQGTPKAKVGGGLGPPIGAPDPLQQYRWPIMGSFAVVFLSGVLIVVIRGHSSGASVKSQEISHDTRARDLRREVQRRISVSGKRNRRRANTSRARVQG